MSRADLVHLSASAMAMAVRTRQVTATELLEAHLERIERLDGHLNAFRVVLAASARAEAARIDARLSSFQAHPLLGVPIAVKDTMDLAGCSSLCGTASEQPIASKDSEAVARLRRAGAIVLGKTNLPELAAWPFTSSTTWGRTVNPWDDERDPGGSSGGSAVAVAAKLCGLALGDDLGGSLRVPASCTGVFGLKPQRDRVPLTPHEGRIRGLGTYGPLTRTVADAGVALDVLAASDRFSRASRVGPARLRIGVSIAAPVVGASAGPVARFAIARASKLLRDLGHDVRNVEVVYRPLLPVAFLLRYFAGLATEFSNLADPSKTEARTRQLARVGRRVSPGALAWASRYAAEQARITDALFDTIDVLLTPVLTTSPARSDAWTKTGLVQTLWGVARYSPYAALANMTGQPACSVPIGVDDLGLPVGVQLVARSNDEVTLLALAGELERAEPFAALDRPEVRERHVKEEDEPPLGERITRREIVA